MAHVSVEYSSGVVGVFDSKEAAIKAVIQIRAGRYKPTGLGTYPTDVDLTVTEWDGTAVVKCLDWVQVDQECTDQIESLLKEEEPESNEDLITRLREAGYLK